MKSIELSSLLSLVASHEVVLLRSKPSLSGRSAALVSLPNFDAEAFQARDISVIYPIGQEGINRAAELGVFPRPWMEFIKSQAGEKPLHPVTRMEDPRFTLERIGELKHDGFRIFQEQGGSLSADFLIGEKRRIQQGNGILIQRARVFKSGNKQLEFHAPTAHLKLEITWPVTKVAISNNGHAGQDTRFADAVAFLSDEIQTVQRGGEKGETGHDQNETAYASFSRSVSRQSCIA